MTEDPMRQSSLTEAWGRVRGRVKDGARVRVRVGTRDRVIHLCIYAFAYHYAPTQTPKHYHSPNHRL